jgi:hypothetical protein
LLYEPVAYSEKCLKVHPHVNRKAVAAKIPKGVICDLHRIVHAIEAERLSHFTGTETPAHQRSIVLADDILGVTVTWPPGGETRRGQNRTEYQPVFQNF